MRAEGARGAKSSHGSQGDRKRRFGLQGSSYGGDLGAARDSLRSEEFGRSLMGAGKARAWGHMEGSREDLGRCNNREESGGKSQEGDMKR